MIDEHLAFLYDESERNLKKACGEGESLPFTRKELLDRGDHRGRRPGRRAPGVPLRLPPCAG